MKHPVLIGIFFLSYFLTNLEANPEPNKQNEKQAASAQKDGSSIEMINIQKRAEDLVTAFHLLRNSQGQNKIFLKTAKEEIGPIFSLKSVGNGTMLAVQMQTMHGLQTQILFVENVQQIYSQS